MTTIATTFGSRTLQTGPAKRNFSLTRGILAWYSLKVERMALSRLDDHLLNDIGVSKKDAKKEAKRPVWDAPSRWLR